MTVGVAVDFGCRVAARIAIDADVDEGEGTSVAVAGAIVDEVEATTDIAVGAVVAGKIGSGETLHAVSVLKNKSSNKCFLDTTHLVMEQRTNAIVRRFGAPRPLLMRRLAYAWPMF